MAIVPPSVIGTIRLQISDLSRMMHISVASTHNWFPDITYWGKIDNSKSGVHPACLSLLEKAFLYLPIWTIHLYQVHPFEVEFNLGVTEVSLIILAYYPSTLISLLASGNLLEFALSTTPTFPLG